MHAGDIITIYSQALEVKEKILRFSHDMYNEETKELAATTAITGIYLDTQIRKSTPLPSFVKERVRELPYSDTRPSEFHD